MSDPNNKAKIRADQLGKGESTHLETDEGIEELKHLGASKKSTDKPEETPRTRIENLKIKLDLRNQLEDPLFPRGRGGR